MSDVTPPPAPSPEAGPEPTRRRGRKRWLALHWTRRALLVAAGLFAAAVVTFLTVDVARLPGLDIRRRAEEQATKYFNRPTHIKRISAYLSPGDFAVEDITIDGRKPGDAPFFHADRVNLHVGWSLLHRAVTVDVRLTGWHMTVESWADGHNVPKLVPKRDPNKPPTHLPFTTTVAISARGGTFEYRDHVTPWSVVAPNLGFDLVHAENLKQYVGTARFSGGTVQIQDFLPMRTDLTARFALDGSLVRLSHIDLLTDGAVSHASGVVDFAHWPDQTYSVVSNVDLARMRELFFARESWRVKGQGQFTGRFRLGQGVGHELIGMFESSKATLDDVDYTDLRGALDWIPGRFDVSSAAASVLGGTMHLSYSIAPLGQPSGSMGTFKVAYADFDVTALDRLIDLKGLTLAGRASGWLDLQWPMGHMAAGRSGRGQTTIVAPAGVALAPADLPAVPRPVAVEPRPFQPTRPLGRLAVGGTLAYTIDPGGWTFSSSWAATPSTYVRFEGRMASGNGASNFPFHVTSQDWQDSDRVLAGIMTALGNSTSAVEMGGRGTFDGQMTGSFSAPRIQGRVTSEDTRVWDVTWGHAEGDVIIHDRYVDITTARITGVPGASIVASGRYALGYRQDGQDEINARVVISNWPMVDLRHAFQLDDWPLDGTAGHADLKLTGTYKKMFGTSTGPVRLEHGSAWKERFETATAQIDLEGTGLHLSDITLTKAPGVVHGDARIHWNGTYEFSADGEGIAVGSLDNFKLARAPLSGVLHFHAGGAGRFEAPSYEFDGGVPDLYASDQGIGDVSGRIVVDNRTLRIERLAVRSALLVEVDGRGTIALNDNYDADLHVSFTQSALHPYLRFVLPEPISPHAKATLDGSMDIRGPLARPHELAVDGNLSRTQLTLFDYDLTNDGPVTLSYRGDAFRIGQLRLRGEDTNLELSGGADVAHRAWNLSATGDANLAVLQLFPLNVEASGTASLRATLAGTFDHPSLAGGATLTDGRMRPRTSAHSLEAINGRIAFDSAGINFSGVTGRIGNGVVAFGGSIGVNGLRPEDLVYNMTINGRQMRLRYPQGFTSVVNMALQLVGQGPTPRLNGRIDVIRSSLDPLATDLGLFGLAAGGAGALGAGAAQAADDGGIPLDISVIAPRMTFVDQKDKRLEGRANLRVGGTFNRPIITGSLDILGGDILFNGNRLRVLDGGVDFTNPQRTEAVFDVAAVTRVRAPSATPGQPSQTFDITVRISGPPAHPTLFMSSEPSLSDVQILSLLFGASFDTRSAEQQQLSSSQEAQQRMIQGAATTLLANTLPVDTIQITPFFETASLSNVSSSGARITVSTRISSRATLTYTRTQSTVLQDDVVLLEYEQSDLLSWVLSRNEDRTFSLDFRIRHVF